MTFSDPKKTLREAILRNPAYKLAYEDIELLAKDAQRPLRLQMELLKPEHILREQGIHSTVVVFGSARIASLDAAQEQLAQAKICFDEHPNNPQCKRDLSTAKRQIRQAKYFEEARRFATLVSRRFQQEDRRDFVIVTGGGPGIMEAANLGAFEADARSIGLNITLPHEQQPNPYITPDLAFRFHYFAVRKMHFLMRAKALVAFPGGFGTFDELFEVLTLIQTGKMDRIPIVLFGITFWQQAINFDFLIEEGLISPADRDLFTMVETSEQVIAVLEEFYQGAPPL